MKRRALKSIVFLLAGAIINVAVAWGCALLIDWERLKHHRQGWSHSGYGWNFDVSYGATTTVVLYHPESVQWKVDQTKDRPPLWSLTNYPPANDERNEPMYQEDARGWPLRSLLSHESWELDPSGKYEIVSLRWGIKLERKDFRADCIIPLRPLWPGFAINTIFYAAVLWMLFVVPGAVRRRIVVGGRIKRGECASCGYSLHQNTSDKCPECGARARARALS